MKSKQILLAITLVLAAAIPLSTFADSSSVTPPGVSMGGQWRADAASL